VSVPPRFHRGAGPAVAGANGLSERNPHPRPGVAAARSRSASARSKGFGNRLSRISLQFPRAGASEVGPDPERIAAAAADHVTIGFLQGAGFALAGIMVGAVISVVLYHFTGFLAGVAVCVWLFMRAKKRNRKLPA